MNKVPFCVYMVVSCAAAASVDVCHSLCLEFSADRRGNGFNLCEELSNCVDGLCSNIYWSQITQTQSGLIYSTTGADELEPDELASPVTCHQAGQLVAPPRARRFPFRNQTDYFSDLFNTQLEVFIRLPTITPLLTACEFTNGTLLANLRDHLALNGSRESRATIIDQLPGFFFEGELSPLSLMQNMFEEISADGNAFEFTTRTSVTCLSCASVVDIYERGEFIGFDTISGNMVTLDLDNMIAGFLHHRQLFRCRHCGGRQVGIFESHFLDSPRLVVIQLQRFHEWSEYMMTGIRAPHNLTIADQSFRLVAIIHRESRYGGYFANFFVDRQWFEYRHDRITRIDLADNALSSTASAFFYYNE